jgi:hypothetical protein
MAQNTSASVSGGSRKSKRAASSATTRTVSSPASQSNRTKRGTSATKRQTAQDGAGQSIEPVTEPRRAASARSGPGLLVESHPLVVAALDRDLVDIRRRAPELADGILVATLYAMARELDDPINSATSKSMCAKALLDGLERLHALLPVEEENDALDDLARRRAARMGSAEATR